MLPLTAPAAAIGAVANTGTEPKESLGELITRGFTAGALRADEKVVLLKFEGEQGDEYWAGLHNSHVITRYNRSPMYALAVWQLAQELLAVRNAPRAPAGEVKEARNAPPASADETTGAVAP